MNIFQMPRMGVTMETGKIVTWNKKEGDYVEIGEIIMEIEYEKARAEIESPFSGYIKKILYEEGSEVPVLEPLVVIMEEDKEPDPEEMQKRIDELRSESKQETAQGETSEAAAAAAVKDNSQESKAEQLQTKTDSQASEKPQKKKPVKVSPRVRRTAKKLGVDLESVSGTGSDGNITEDDVKRAAEKQESKESEEVEGGPVKVKERRDLNAIQKSMANNITSSWQNIPQFTQIVTINADRLLRIKDEIEGVSLNDLMVKLVAQTVRENMIVNSTFDDSNNQIIIYEDVNLSVAMATDHGLITPVIRNTDNKPVLKIAEEVRELNEKAKNNKLGQNDISDSTITVSNLGYFGVEYGTPIINSPQSAIVFIGAINKEPIVGEDGEIKIANILRLSIAYDHRFIEGIVAAGFTTGLKNNFENFTINQLFE